MAIDRDPEAIRAGRRRFAGESRLTLVRGSFGPLEERVRAAGVEGELDGVLLDLGVSSPQLDEAGRGFSFMQDGPLDMRMDNEAGQSAAQWLAKAGEREIADVLRELGEERFARRIARAIVAARAAEPDHAHRRNSRRSSPPPCRRASPASTRRRARSRRSAST